MPDSVNIEGTPLTPENIQQYLDTMSKSMLDTLKSYMESKITPLATRLEEIANPPKDKPVPPKDALTARLTELENQLVEAKKVQETKDKEASQLRFNQALSQELDNYPLSFKSDTFQILQSRLQDVTEVDGKWQLKDGKLLTEYISTFMGTDLGKHLQVNSIKSGTGTPENRKAPPDVSKTVEAELWDAFV